MKEQRMNYQLVGRYMKGKEVTGYHIQSIETGETCRASKELVCFLTGREQVINCTGQIYHGKVILRGKGICIEDLPIQQESNDFNNTEKIVKPKTNNNKNTKQYMITGSLIKDEILIGYTIMDVKGAQTRISKIRAIEIMNKIGNLDCNLDALPKIRVN